MSQDAQIHDARQDAARYGTAGTGDTRAIPTGAAADAPTRSHAAVQTDPTRSQPVTAVRSDETARDTVATDSVVEEVPTRETVVARERAQFGGIQIGSAFFGWLAATGLAVILTALVTAIGAAVVGTQDVTADLAADPAAFGWVGAIALLVILLVAYYSGGYVAGRMARFSGAKQGVAVWAWACPARGV